MQSLRRWEVAAESLGPHLSRSIASMSMRLRRGLKLGSTLKQEDLSCRDPVEEFGRVL